LILKSFYFMFLKRYLFGFSFTGFGFN